MSWKGRAPEPAPWPGGYSHARAVAGRPFSRRARAPLDGRASCCRGRVATPPGPGPWPPRPRRGTLACAVALGRGGRAPTTAPPATRGPPRLRIGGPPGAAVVVQRALGTRAAGGATPRAAVPWPPVAGCESRLGSAKFNGLLLVGQMDHFY
jgi:hypothetical protein